MNSYSYVRVDFLCVPTRTYKFISIYEFIEMNSYVRTGFSYEFIWTQTYEFIRRMNSYVRVDFLCLSNFICMST
jgi:hypothetical protein